MKSPTRNLLNIPTAPPLVWRPRLSSIRQSIRAISVMLQQHRNSRLERCPGLCAKYRSPAVNVQLAVVKIARTKARVGARSRRSPRLRMVARDRAAQAGCLQQVVVDDTGSRTGGPGTGLWRPCCYGRAAPMVPILFQRPDARIFGTHADNHSNSGAQDVSTAVQTGVRVVVQRRRVPVRNSL
jgi:hypothetical protein